MFGSQVLDVAVGLVFVYLLVSLIVSVANEWITRAMALRASTLEDGLRNLLQDPKPRGDEANTLLDYLYNHPLIQGVSPLRSRGRILLARKRSPAGTKTSGLSSQQTVTAAQTAVPRGAQVEVQKVLASTADSPRGLAVQPPAAVSLGAATRTGRPSYIDPRAFSLALLDLVAPVGMHSKDFAVLKAEVSTIENERLQRTLLTLVNAGEGNIESARANIEAWFNQGMQRVSGWYKRKVQIISLCVGLALATLLNADTLAVVRALWSQPTVRDAIAKSAEQYVQRSAPPDVSATSTFDAQRQKIETSLGELSAPNLPIGWILEASAGDSPRSAADPRRLPDVLSSPTAILSKVIGVLLTGAAVSLGAHFWFDTLEGLTSLRSTGSPPAVGHGG